MQRLNATDQASLPVTLVELRDAFLTASSAGQTEALAAELRRHIQHLNRTHRAALQQQRKQEQQIAARHYTQQVILNVVRVSADRVAPSNEQARRDREMEEQWCAAHRELLHRLEQHGIASQPLRAHAPGESAVQCVPPDAVQHARRARVQRTGGRLRQREI